MVLWTLDLGCLDVGVWLCGRWILVVWTLEYGCVDIGFCLYGRWILVGWMLDRCQNVTSIRHQKHTSGYSAVNIHEIWLHLFRGEHSLYIRAKLTSFLIIMQTGSTLEEHTGIEPPFLFKYTCMT